MGAKASKFDLEGSYLPDTPLNKNKMKVRSTQAQMQQDAEAFSTPMQEKTGKIEQDLRDPRSPSCRTRTPINFYAPTQSTVSISTSANEGSSGGAFAQFRKRLLKGLALNDPRSPQLNRTPLVFDEVLDRTLNMDDTFADLFVETRVPTQADKPLPKTETEVEPELKTETDAELERPQVSELLNNSSVEIVSLPSEEIVEPVPQQLTPPPQSVQHDPRSPTIGVDRTPIMFCDDDEDDEALDAQMEQILETLTLNLSTESSMASFVSASADLTFDEPQPKPSNKHLDRVRLGGKQRMAPRKPARSSRTPKTPQQIYVDAECDTPKSTPLTASAGGGGGPKRTPLSCVKNRANVRSRSVEKDFRKARLPLQSFDDQLNPSECHNVSNLHKLMSFGEDNLEASIY